MGDLISGRRSGLAALPLLAVLSTGCPGGSERASPSPPAPPPPPAAAARRLAPPAAARRLAPPNIPNVTALDRDGDHVDDWLLRENADVADVEAVFDSSIGARETEAFVREGGVVHHVFRAVSNGFSGRIPRARLHAAAAALGPRLLILKGQRPTVRHLDEATRTGRVRPVWATGFGGTSGLSGAGVNIAFLDTGIDESHPDLAGRKVGWKDYTTDALAAPSDIDGHGTHVAGIALGSGAAFGVGPGTLRYTDTGDLLLEFAGDYDPAPIHLPPVFDFTSRATWEGTGTSSLALRSGTDGTASYNNVALTATTAPPLSLSFSEPGATTRKFTTALVQNDGNGIRAYAVANQVTNYPAVGDGFPALRGVAASAGWFEARVFPTSGTGTTEPIAEAMDDLLTLYAGLEIKVVNMSFGVGGDGDDPTLRAKVDTLVDNGLVVVCSGGNGGMSAPTVDPGRSADAITVGSTNDSNQLAVYTSAGFSAGATPPAVQAPDTADKLDILAPGGSPYDSMILSVDSNSADGRSPTLADAQANDYTSLMGTSMAAPFVAGSAALVIDALEQSGTAWTFGTSAAPLLVKMLLLASATETNAIREGGHGGDPVLGRAASPRDAYEGYGIVNPDAAVEAVLLAWDIETPVVGSTTGTPADRRAWGRKMTVAAGHTLSLSLTVAPTGDFDLYAYDAAPGPAGAPQLAAAGVSPTLGAAEAASVTAPAAARSLYIFVKRVSGSGSFTLTAATLTCGDASPCGIVPPDAQSPSPFPSATPSPVPPETSPAIAPATASPAPTPPPSSPSSAAPSASPSSGCAAASSASPSPSPSPPTFAAFAFGILLAAGRLRRRG